MNSAFALQEVGCGGISPAEPIAAHVELREAKPCYSELSPGQRQKTTRTLTDTEGIQSKHTCLKTTVATEKPDELWKSSAEKVV